MGPRAVLRYPLYRRLGGPQGRSAVPIVQEAGWAPGPVCGTPCTGGWMGPRAGLRYPLYRRLDGPQGRSGQVRKISPPTGIRSPDRPALSQSKE